MALLEACYAMSGTEIAYAAAPALCGVRRYLSCYALSTRCPVLSLGMLLQRVVSGTDPEYAATRRLCSEDTSAEDLVGLLQVRRLIPDP
eukprot:1223739-Rhodomonas_salina.2